MERYRLTRAPASEIDRSNVAPEILEIETVVLDSLGL